MKCVVVSRLFSLLAFAICVQIAMGLCALQADISIPPSSSKKECARELRDAQWRIEVLQGLRALLAHNRISDASDRVNLNFNQLRQDRSERTTKILKAAGVNIPSGAILHRRALMLFQNSWDLALREAGEDPASIRKETKVLTLEKLMKVLKHLDEAGVSLQANVFRQDQSSETQAQIRRALNEDFSPWTINEIARDNFDGDWYAALTAAGVDAEKHRSPYNLHQSVNKENVGPLLRALDAGEVDISPRTFSDDHSEKTEKIIESILGKMIKPETILMQVRELYQGDWYAALSAAGVDVKKYKTERVRAVNMNNVGSLLQALASGNVDLSSKNFEQDASETTAKIIESVLGKRLATSTILTEVRALYPEGWYASLDANGVDSQKYRLNHKWTRDDFLKVGQILLRAKKGENVEALVAEALGRSVKYKTLWAAVHRSSYIHNLRELVEYTDLRSQIERTSWTKPKIKKALLALYEAGFLPSSGFLQNQKGILSIEIDTMKILHRATGNRTSLRSLFSGIEKLYKNNLDAALQAAGLDAEEIRQREKKFMWKEEPFAIPLAMLALDEAGIPPSYDILKTHNEEFKAAIAHILEVALGQRVNPLSLLRAIQVNYPGGLVAAQTDAGLDPDHIHRLSSIDWSSKTDRLKMIAFQLREMGYRVSLELLTASAPKIRSDVERIIEQNLGTSIYPLDYLRLVNRFFEGDIAGDPREWRLRDRQSTTLRSRRGYSWAENRAKYLETLRALHAAGIPPNPMNLTSQDPDLKARQAALIKTHMGKAFSPLTFYSAIHEHYDTSIISLLKEAGLDPSQILIRMPAHFRRTHLSTQVEYGRSSEPGEISGGRLVGSAREYSPLQNTSEAEASHRLHDAMNSEPESQRELIAWIVKAVSEMPEQDLNPKAIAERISRRYKQNVSSEEIENLFNALRSNPILLDLSTEPE